MKNKQIKIGETFSMSEKKLNEGLKSLDQLNKSMAKKEGK